MKNKNNNPTDKQKNHNETNNNKTNLIRIQKLISNYGYCSRRKAEELIKKGLVKVNDKIVRLGDKATENDEIFINGKKIEKKNQKKIYILLNKPFGYTTSMSDPHEKKLVKDLIKIKERIFPIGRLDKWTSGMLILTNDGLFANKVMHPKNKIKKTYYVKVDKNINDSHLNSLNGIDIDGRKVEAQLKRLSQNEFEITIHEGRNRIIRRMLEKIGYKVKVLIRIKIGNLELGHLKPGYWRFLKEKDLDMIFSKN
ncbi:MAG: pseudouridine synthase [Candidatus Woesearchaeota archaeon]